MSAAQAPQPSAEDLALVTFARSTLDLLTFWPALRIAVQQGWGGQTGITHLAEDIVDVFYTTATQDISTTNANPTPPTADTAVVPETDDIEDVLLHVLSHEFNITLEDGSETLIAKDLVGLWRECIHRAVTSPPYASGLTEKFAAGAAKARAEDGVRQYAAQAEGDSSDDDDDDSDDEMDDEDDVEMSEEHVHSASCSHGHSHAPRRQEPEVDEDGFQMVTKKAGRR